MLKLSTEDRRLIGVLLTTSWISALVAVVAGLVVTVGVIAAFELHNSTVQQQLVAWQQTQVQPQPALTTPNQVLAQNDRPTIKGSWPLLVIWSLIGLAVYVIAAGLMHSLARAEALRESLDDVHAKPRELVTTTAEHVLLRLIAFIILIFLFRIFLKQLLPYSITAARASAADIWSVNGIIYAIVSFAMIVISVHVQTIFLRLTLGRVRIFSDI